jgi:hypothetical protein
MDFGTEAFENRIRHRPGIEPGEKLRARVLQSVASELSRSPHAIARPAHSRYWAAAAVALIAINLSAICGSGDAFSFTRPGSPRQRVVDLQSLRQFEAQQEGLLK